MCRNRAALALSSLHSRSDLSVISFSSGPSSFHTSLGHVDERRANIEPGAPRRKVIQGCRDIRYPFVTFGLSLALLESSNLSSIG